jgi:hypothetical protein
LFLTNPAEYTKEQGSGSSSQARFVVFEDREGWHLPVYMSMKLCKARQWGFRHIFTWAVTTCSRLAVSSQHSWGPARELMPKIPQ